MQHQHNRKNGFHSLGFYYQYCYKQKHINIYSIHKQSKDFKKYRPKIEINSYLIINTNEHNNRKKNSS